jgi:hypothetical protein
MRFKTVRDAWSKGLNETYWKWCLVFSAGNDLNISLDRVKERIRFIAANLLRMLYGNHYRRKNAHIACLTFQHGDRLSFDQHYHVMIGIDGPPHDWGDWRIMMTIKQLDRAYLSGRGLKQPIALKGYYRMHREKLVHIDWRWREGNQMHSYVSRYVQLKDGSSDNWDAWSL